MEKNEDPNGRRSFLKKGALLTVAGITSQAIFSSIASGQKPAPAKPPVITGGNFTLPTLPYGYDAMEPYIDKMTMEIHHTKHHQAYVNNLNKACDEGNIHIGLDEIIKNVSKYSVAVRNNGGGHWNHSFFWKLMKKNPGGAPTGKLAEAIKSKFGTFEDFKTAFGNAGKNRFGSGWVWLVVNKGKLEIGSTPNQDNPLMDISEFKGKPLLALDVWEHAYYLNYLNIRADYITAWWNVVNWNEVAANFV